MAVLPGAIIGELLERLNAERRRVVLDGFEPHADEWSRTWSGRRGSDTRQAGGRDASEVEVLEQIADDLLIEEVGQPTAADIVVILTSAIRRAPERAAIIVDAMLTDHPKMAVVIVATALRTCPGLRKEILATARRHKPFSRHPFILGILLAVVAKILADHGAEAAEPFEGLEAPSEILAALGRHYATSRPPPAEGGARGGERVTGFGPLGTPAFVATVMVAGDAWSRTMPADAEAVSHASGSFKAAPAVPDDAATASVASDRLDGDPADDRLHPVARQEHLPEAREDAAPFALPVDRAQHAEAAAAPDGDTPRMMAAVVPPEDGARNTADASPVDGATDGNATQADTSVAASDEVFDVLPQKVAGTPADPIFPDAPPRDLVDMQAADAAHPAEAEAMGHAEADVAWMTPGAVPPDAEIAQELDANAVTGTAITAEVVLPGDDGVVAHVAVPIAASAEVSLGETGIETTADVVLGGEEGLAVVDLDTGLALGAAVTADLETDLALLDQDKLADIEVGLDTTIADVADLGTSVSLELIGANGVADVDLGAAAQLGGIVETAAGIGVTLLDEDAAAKVEAKIDALLPGIAAAEAKGSVDLLDEGMVANVEGDIHASVGDVAEAKGSAELEVLGDGGVADADLDAGVQVADAVAADAEAGITLLDEDTAAKVDAEVGVSAAGVEAATVEADVALTGSGGPVVELQAEVADELLSIDVGLSSSGLTVDLDLLPEDEITVPVVEDAIDTVETIIGITFGGSLLGGKPEPEDDEPPPPPSHPVQSVLDSLGGLFG